MSTSHKLYLGYDLGDGETQLSMLSPDQESLPESIRMPTAEGNNEPIITAYAVNKDKIVLGNNLFAENANYLANYHANFKVKPTEVIKALPREEQETIRQMCTEHDTSGIITVLKRYENSQTMMAKCVKEFTNAILNHEQITKELISYQDKCDEISLFIGYPTKWDQDDILIYKAMLEDSILGKGELVDDAGHRIPLTFNVEPESRAAFLHGRKKYVSQGNKGWEIDKYTLVIDVGSSTLDVSAMSGLEADNAHDDGHPFLGARLIDKAIYNYYRKVLDKNGELSNLDRLIQQNPTVEKLFILACRKAKETYFSSTQPLRVLSPIESVRDIKIPRKEMDSILATSLSELDAKVKWIDGRSWEHELESFLKKQKDILDKNQKIVNRIILTGGAARMEFVQETCKRVFKDTTIHYDGNPGVAISHGLALVGRSNEKSVEFRQEADSLIGNDLQELVKEKIPELAEKLSKIIASIILDDIAFTELKSWKSRSHYTLDGAISAIKGKCTESNLKTRLTSSSSYNQALQDWVKKNLIYGINRKLLNLCHKYGLTDFSTKDVDITTVPIDATVISEISAPGKVISKDILDPADALAAIVAIISGIVTYIVVPTVLYIVISLVISITAAISTTLAWIIASILAAIPGAGWTILCILAGVSAFVLVANGWESMREEISTSMMSYDLPQWVRNRVDNDKIKSALNDSRSSVTSTIENELKSTKSSTEIAEQVADSLSPQIEKKIQEIRYIIESR
ncbi:MAG: Hsp70 family protein [Xenococcus sp. (in: cyanobacteria)]